MQCNILSIFLFMKSINGVQYSMISYFIRNDKLYLRYIFSI